MIVKRAMSLGWKILNVNEHCFAIPDPSSIFAFNILLNIVSPPPIAKNSQTTESPNCRINISNRKTVESRLARKISFVMTTT